MTCTCPRCDTGKVVPRAKDCPDHGLKTLNVQDDFVLFSYGDGIQVLAKTQASADEMHGVAVARRNRQSA